MSIKIHIYLFLMAAYMFAVQKLEIFIYFYTFTLMHELAHIIIALILKIDIKEIMLLPFGINAKYSNKISNIKELIISLAGPLASFLFSIYFNNEIFKSMNLIICLFNLIPIYPFDGGKIIRSFLVLLNGRENGQKYSYIITQFFLILLILLSLVSVAYVRNYYFIALTIYIFYIVKDEIKKEQIYKIINYLQTD